ncbi:MAG TPA: alkene reductase [Quisquiliibacterium sp.]|nr:alkene reductase [Quisquiliibacterium sp.]HQP66623.1 alkene reductase [Quisquiliibacterium sp.]
MSTQALFEPLKVGPYTLSHRVVMAPLTRMRATKPGNHANAMNAEYYAQRATRGGLIIAEASQVLQGGAPGPGTPGIHTPEQVAGWKLVVDAIHAKGGLVFLQLWHVGRLSNAAQQPDGGPAIGASAIAAPGTRVVRGENVPYETPRALRLDEIPGIIEAYAQAARNAKAAGFDGIEIHAANGYLLEQFMQSRSNQRTDAYGGSIENRARLVLEVTAACAQVWGSDRVGIRLSPFGVANGSGEDDPMPLYSHVIGALNRMGLAYLHLIEPRASGAGQREVDHQGVPSAAELFRPAWNGVLIAAGNFKPDTATAMVEKGDADAIAFGRYFISNPDLPERIRVGAPFTPYNRPTFYTSGPEGYLDYPAMSA